MRHWRVDDFGLLALGELDDSPAAAGVEQAIRQGHLTGFSRGFATSADIPVYRSSLVIPTVRMTRAAIHEVSVTSQPGFAEAKILGVGLTAELAWDREDLASIALVARTGLLRTAADQLDPAGADGNP
jgi:phage head maturation protease